jgi:hypothetical protein
VVHFERLLLVGEAQGESMAQEDSACEPSFEMLERDSSPLADNHFDCPNEFLEFVWQP